MAACPAAAERAAVLGSDVALRFAPLGRGRSRALHCVLAPARQPLLGWHVRGDRLSAKPWRLTAQGLVSRGRHCDRRGGYLASDCVLSAKRDGFLFGLALWGAACNLWATLLRNFAAYAASLAGFTAAISCRSVLHTKRR